MRAENLEATGSVRPFILDELDRVEQTDFYREWGWMLSGIHQYVRSQYGHEDQNKGSLPESSSSSVTPSR